MSPAKSVTPTVTLPPGSVESAVEPPAAKPPVQIVGRRAVDSLLSDHIRDEERVWSDLKIWQKTLDEKLDTIITDLARNNTTCDEIREFQAAGRVVSAVVRWGGGIAAAVAGFVGLWAAIKALTGIHPPGPQ